MVINTLDMPFQYWDINYTKNLYPMNILLAPRVDYVLVIQGYHI